MERGLMGLEFQFRKTKILEILCNSVDVLHVTKLEKGWENTFYVYFTTKEN